ncbi:MAG: 4-hydroxythreonine-4-phosphate dehydrogenase PdxA [Planctomycetaceae bacterium]|jgi:4-hydroxythreonine-4-phosphate dehydrogenase|nr:4-hydroxythreonine-4-phosphate dehydrogenase PdxA [Planctomycetaceae bacterium]
MRTIAMTMGDAAGVGPEIIAGAWKHLCQIPDCRCVVYGHPEMMRRAAALRGESSEIRCVPCCSDDVAEVPAGQIDARAGLAAYQCIVRAIADAKNGKADAVVTAPIHKAALNLAGFHYPGHTEIFAEQCGVNDFAMMLYLGAGENIQGEFGLAVVHVTLHTAMKTVFDQITAESVSAKIVLADRFMRTMIGGKRPPRIGVCSLNPHAGENGLFGDEEIRIIRPAVRHAVENGILAEGPKPADTIMIDAKNGQYDAVVAMFHDQGHIALKLLGMHRAVNITLGLPIIRTSVAHGTAFDKAWQGTALTGSFIEAVNTAVKLAAVKR